MTPARLAIAVALVVVGCVPERKAPSDPPPPPPPQCTEGQTFVSACGNCGETTATCVSGGWTLGSCVGEGVCTPGAEQFESCGTDVGACVPGTLVTVCTYACEWQPQPQCLGSVGPAAEACGNGLDDDCDGMTDEGCLAESSVYVSGRVAKLVASPDGSVVYALDTGAAPSVIVFDAATHAELTRIALPRQGNDMDLSPNGQHLVVAYDAAKEVSVVDPATRTLLYTRAVASDPWAIEVDDAGVVYYVEYDQWVDLRTVNATLDLASDTRIGTAFLYAADIELSADGAHLYAGEGGLSGSSLYAFDVATGAIVDESTWDGGYGFGYPERRVYLAPGGERVYYAYHQLDATDLAFVTGGTPTRVLAEDRAGTLAVGTTAVLDALTLRHVTDLPRQPSCATFAAGDQELWYYDGSTGRLYWVPKAAISDGALGSRALAAEPLGDYGITRLVRDPLRPRLYGLDAARDVVVAIDAGTLQPLGAIRVGSYPTDLAVSLAGDALYVGHLDTLGVARIDLAAFTFDRFLVVPRVPYDVEPLSGGRLAFIDEDQWTTPTILDPATGAVVAEAGWPTSIYEGALAATADGNRLFVGEGGLSGSNLYLFDVSTSAFTELLRTTYDGGYGFPYPQRHVVIVPDGSAAYYAGYLIDGSNLTALRYAQPDRVYTVTPDGLKATSSGKVYRVSDGAVLGTLPVQGAVQAVSADGATLYVSTPGAITAVDLAGY